MKVLIIEDDLGIAELMRESLEEVDYKVFVVESFVDADLFLMNEKPHLMIVDYHVTGGQNAQDWLHRRTDEKLPIPPFVVSTGQGDERIAVNMMKLGARDYLIKDTLLMERLPKVVKRVRVEIENELQLKQAKADLKEKEEKYRLLVENSGIGVGLYSLEGKILYFNKRAVDNLGGKAEDYIGKSLFDIFGDKLGETYFRRITEVAKKNISVEFTDSVTLQSGEYWFLSNHTPVKNHKGEIVGVQVLAHDITARIKAENEIKKISDFYRAIIENASDGVTILNEHNRYSYVSPTGLRIFGYELNEIIDAEPDKMTHPDDLPNVLMHLTKMFENPDYSPTLEYRFAHKNGNWIWIESTFTNLLNNDSINGIVINFRDINERKIAELALEESKKVLNKLLRINSELINSDLTEIEYAKFTDIMLEISGAKYVSFNLFDSNGLDFTTQSFSGLPEISLKAMDFLGFDPLNKKWKHDPYRAEKLKKNVITVFDSLADLTKIAIPEKVSKLIQKSFNLGQIVVAKVITQKALIGDFTLLFEKGETLQNYEIVELFVSQFAQYLERMKAEAALRLKMDEMIRFKNVTVGRELAMIELKKEVNELLSKLGKSEKYRIVG